MANEHQEGPKRKIGLKVKSPEPSSTPNSKSSRENFEKKADEQFDAIQSYKNDIWDLSIKFKSFIESKVLPENKGPLALSLEKEVLEKLIHLAMTMNTDATQEEGSGSAALCMLLMKCMLLQRDMLNKLSYQVEQLSKK